MNNTEICKKVINPLADVRMSQLECGSLVRLCLRVMVKDEMQNRAKNYNRKSGKVQDCLL